MRKYLKIVIPLCIFLLLLGFLDLFIPDDIFLQDYVRGTFTETLGIIVTLIFVQLIFSRHEENDYKKQEALAIYRASKVLGIYISDYKTYAYQVVTPLDKREGNIKEEIPNNFTFNDMSDLFVQSMVVFDDFDKPVVIKCLESQENIKTAIENALYNINFKNFPEISNLFVQYIDFVGKFNLYDGILQHSKSNFGNQKMKDFISKKLIKEHQGEVEYLPSNMKNTYIALYHLIKFHASFFERYKVELEKMKKYIESNS